jgi:hypothetical protein
LPEYMNCFPDPKRNLPERGCERSSLLVLY